MAAHSCPLRLLTLGGLAAFATQSAFAQAVPVYEDQLVNGFDSWSWCTVNLNDTAYVHSGSAAAGITFTGAWQGFELHTSPFLVDPFASLNFYINGGPTANRTINVYALKGGVALPTVSLNKYVHGGSVRAKAWELVSIPITALGLKVGDRTDGFVLQEASGAAQPKFWIDDIVWAAAPLPTGITITVDTTANVRTVDLRHFGVNTAIWDNLLDTTATKAAMVKAGYRMFRYPGGSASDSYHWQTNRSDGNTWSWAIGFDQFADAAAAVSGQSYITTNYGSGTPTEAAAWVTYSKSKKYGFKYWEVGNECYGTWENDTHTRKNDPWTYGQQFALFATPMRGADGTIKVGAVALPGEDQPSPPLFTDHPATNPRTKVKHNGWTPVMLATMAAEKVYPDFIVYHRYPENTGDECDYTLLQTGYTWASDVANLRQQLNDYLGAAQAAKIEIICDENNEAGNGSGKQSVSLVDGLFLADSFGNMLNTECNALVFWDLFNDQDPSGNMGAWLYGWRLYGDYGQLDPSGNPYPAYYVQELLSKYASPGDTVLTCTSSNSYVSSFAVKHSDGSVAVMVINKHATEGLPVQMVINGNLNRTKATRWGYGITQDNAAKSSSSAASAKDISQQNLKSLTAGTWFNLPPYSVNVYVFSPL